VNSITVALPASKKRGLVIRPSEKAVTQPWFSSTTCWRPLTVTPRAWSASSQFSASSAAIPSQSRLLNMSADRRWLSRLFIAVPPLGGRSTLLAR
jgi:hypothetical protein